MIFSFWLRCAGMAFGLLCLNLPSATAQINLLELEVISAEQRTLPNIPEQALELEPPLVDPTALPETEGFTNDVRIRQTVITRDITPIGAPYTDSIVYPETLWKQMGPEGFTNFIRTLRPSRNKAVQTAMRDALLGYAAAPDGMDLGTFFLRRLEGLLRLGFAREAHRLSFADTDFLENLRTEDGLVGLMEDIALLNLDTETLCRLPIDQDISAAKRRILCLLLADDQKQAALELQLLREQSQSAETDVFADLAALVLFNQSQPISDTTFAPTPESMVLAQIGRVAIFQDDFYDQLPKEGQLAASVLLALDQTGLSEDTRMVMAQKGFQDGIVSEHVLQEQYAQLLFSSAEMDNAASLITNFFNQRAVSLGIQQIARLLLGKPKDPLGAKAIAALLLQNADQRGEFLQVYTLLKPYLAEFPDAAASEIALRKAYWLIGRNMPQYSAKTGSVSDVLNRLNGYNIVDNRTLALEYDFLRRLAEEPAEPTAVQTKTAFHFDWVEDFLPLFQEAAVPSTTATRGIILNLKLIAEAINNQDREELLNALTALAQDQRALSQQIAKMYLAALLVAPPEQDV